MSNIILLLSWIPSITNFRPLIEYVITSAKESKNVWDNPEDFWQHVKSNKKLVGIAVSDEQGLDILNALRDIYLRVEEEPSDAKQMLTMLGIVLLASSEGNGKIISNEIAVQAAMEEFEIHMNRILDEESK